MASGCDNDGPRFYWPRDPRASPLCQLVERRFDEFERVYPEHYQERYGFWRPVIRDAVDEYLKWRQRLKG